MTFNFRSLAVFCALATAALSAPQLIPQVSNNTAKGGPAGGGGGGGGGGGKKPMCPDGINKSRNLQCCFLFPILADIQANMFDQGQCGDGAHAALRLAFHDAIGFSNSDAGFGTGADGSIIIFQDVELGYAANTGLDDAVNLEAPVLARNNISASDFLHFAAAISVANCPGAAAPTFMIGRKDATAPAPDGTVPEPFDSVDTILARIEDAGLSAPDLVNLLASHSVAGADDIDPTLVGVPFDSTPSIFDTQFFIETLLKGTLFLGTSGNQGEVMSPLAGEMRLQSDAALARDPRTACLWQANVQNQAQVATNFATAFAKLQVLGQDTTNMIDCSDVIPDPMQLAFNQGVPMFPAGFNITDVEQSCSSTPFPTLPTASGPVTSVAPIPQA